MFKGPERTKGRALAPLVSIIIPVYGTEAYVQRCLDTVLSEDLTDVEVLVVFDGPPDEGDSLKASLEAQNVRWVEHPENLGLFEARKTGAKAATGTHIWHVDSDDVIRSGAVSSIKKAINEHGCDILEFNALRSVNGRTQIVYTKGGRTATGRVDDLLDGQGFFFIWTKCYRRAFYLQHLMPVEMPLKLTVGEDVLANLILLEAAQSYQFINQKIYTYFEDDRADNTAADFSTRAAVRAFEHLSAIYTYVLARPAFNTRKEAVMMTFAANVFHSCIRKRFDLSLETDRARMQREFGEQNARFIFDLMSRLETIYRLNRDALVKRITVRELKQRFIKTFGSPR